MRISFILAVLTFTTVFSACNTVYAQSEVAFSATYSAAINPTGNDIGISRITPASPLYFLKTVRESIEMKLALTPHIKLIRQLEFATRRLREIKSLAGNHEELIQPTLERYWFYINSLPDKDIKDEEEVRGIKESLTMHLEVLQIIYSKLTNPQAKLSVRSIINRITKRSDLPNSAKILACYFLQKEATSSAITESERTILIERAQNCFKGSIYRI